MGSTAIEIANSNNYALWCSHRGCMLRLNTPLSYTAEVNYPDTGWWCWQDNLALFICKNRICVVSAPKSTYMLFLIEPCRLDIFQIRKGECLVPKELTSYGRPVDAQSQGLECQQVFLQSNKFSRGCKTEICSFTTGVQWISV